MKSFEEVESKSFTTKRTISNSGQCSLKLKLSFHVGLKPANSSPTPMLTIVIDGLGVNFETVLRDTEYFDAYVRVNDVAARLWLRQVLASQNLKYDNSKAD